MATVAEELRVEVRERAAKVTEEIAKYSDSEPPSVEQMAQIEGLTAEFKAAKSKLDGLGKFSTLAATWEEQEAHMKEAANQAPLVERIMNGQQAKRARSLGAEFVELPTYQDWLKQVAPSGAIGRNTRLTSPPLHFNGFKDLDQHAALQTGESSTSAGAFVFTERYSGLTELGRRPLVIRDVITNLQTGSDAVEFVRITTETNAATPVAEATATAGGSGVKPESDLAFEVVTTNVRTIANWIAATRRALSDASQLRGLIDAFLRYNLEEELEDQIVAGDGVGQNFTGILNTSGTQAQAWDTNILTTTRRARRKVRTVGRRQPNAYLLNPIDWETIDLLQDNEGRYIFGGPQRQGTPVLWGLPVIESEAVPEGTGLVADFRTCVLWDREEANILVTDSHSDFFIRNMVAILAELRAAFGILKPNAIVEIDLTA